MVVRKFYDFYSLGSASPELNFSAKPYYLPDRNRPEKTNLKYYLPASKTTFLQRKGYFHLKADKSDQKGQILLCCSGKW